MEFVHQMIAQAFDRIMAGDARIFGTLGRTLILAALSTLLAALVGIPLGVRLAAPRTRARRIGLTVANAGLGLPPVVLGVFLALALLPGAVLQGLHWSFSREAIVLGQTLLCLPIVVALTASALAGVPRGLLDQARAYGASQVELAVLAAREARVAMIAMVITAFGSSIAEVGAVVILGGNERGKTDTLASAILLDLSAADPVRATAHAMVLVGVVLILGAVLTAIQYLDRRGGRRDRTAPGPRSWAATLRRTGRPS